MNYKKILFFSFLFMITQIQNCASDNRTAAPQATSYLQSQPNTLNPINSLSEAEKEAIATEIRENISQFPVLLNLSQAEQDEYVRVMTILYFRQFPGGVRGALSDPTSPELIILNDLHAKAFRIQRLNENANQKPSVQDLVRKQTEKSDKCCTLS